MIGDYIDIRKSEYIKEAYTTSVLPLLLVQRPGILIVEAVGHES